ncbi:nuclear transport factor 2 family protein [Lichenihabitans sp. Uapishka_5]|uniref:ester cyclase n=1 Tax=Lichenihabitans sp. Uapishka_5 TaxID=3037302 RepID=UPI0029E809F4|nr:nuclear transport factor 2 family protein [Lichenihabitans sp. Uapishka_5]MDX7952143.1 nuclear transport factor 2 family protein [Lichenihabitans sp. Uapishka_5]
MASFHDIATRWLDLWNGDTTALDAIVAESVITHAVLIGQVTEEPMIGRDALGSWIAQMQAAMPALRFSVEVGPLIDGDLIALRWRVQGEHGAARVSFTGTDMLRVAGERIVEYWVNSDTSLMMAQMQAASPPS